MLKERKDERYNKNSTLYDTNLRKAILREILLPALSKQVNDWITFLPETLAGETSNI